MNGLAENFSEEEMTKVSEHSNENVKEEHEADLGNEACQKKWPGWPGESVFRILVPSHKVGGLIGRKGENIKKMCEESRARIKILGGPPGVTERAVSFSFY